MDYRRDNKMTTCDNKYFVVTPTSICLSASLLRRDNVTTKNEFFLVGVIIETTVSIHCPQRGHTMLNRG